MTRAAGDRVRTPTAMELAPFTLEHVLPFLRQASYDEPRHEQRLLHTARHLPRARTASDVYVDIGTHPLVLHVMARLGGYRTVHGVNWDAGLQAPHQDVTVRETAPSKADFTYRVFNADIEWDRLPFEDGSVALVTCLEAIEHLTCDPMHLLIELNRILADGGQLLLSTPNVISWNGLLRAARGEHPMHFPQFMPGKSNNRHNLEYTPQMMRGLLRSAGFEGTVDTFDAWGGVERRRVEPFIAAGFADFDRGDCMLASVRKAGPPLVRYDPVVYLMDPKLESSNRRVSLTYRKGPGASGEHS